jgi:hypothetical protein
LFTGPPQQKIVSVLYIQCTTYIKTPKSSRTMINITLNVSTIILNLQSNNISHRQKNL